MAKYNELVVKYQKEIAEIKSLKALEEEAKRKMQSFEKANNWDDYDYSKHEKFIVAYDNASMNTSIAIEQLTYEIEMEYYDVPFAKPRKQGKRKFWQLSGLV